MNGIKSWFFMLSFGNIKRYMKLLAWFLLDSVIATIPYGVMLMAIKFFIEPIVTGEELVTRNLWILTGAMLLQFILYYFIRKKTYIDSCVGMAGTMKNSRLKIGEHLRILPMGYYNLRDAGDLSTVLLRDYTTVETLSEQFAPQVCITIVRLLLSVIMLSIFDFRMAIALFVSIPLALPFAFVSYKRMKTSSYNLQKSQQETASYTLEYVEGIQTLKAFNMAGQRFDTLKDSFNRERKAAIDIETKAAAPVAALGRFVLNIGTVFVILLGGVLTVNNELSPFYYLVFLVLALNVYEPVSSIFVFIADFARSKSSGDRIQAIFDEQPLAVDKENTADKMKILDNYIDFSHVSFSYGKQEVLHDITVNFPANAVTALVGPSGSGKSTITRLAARFWDADCGQISIGRVPVKKISADKVLEKVSIVFQDVYLFHDTILANIRMGKDSATKEEVIEAAKKAACHDFIMSLPDGYDTMIGEGGSTLSGGEKQRISIARALLKNAPIVLLDEATAALDPENEVLIQQAISSLVKDKTVIVVAHRLQSICNADKIVVLKDGRIEECGTHKELLDNDGLYSLLWKEQSSSGNWKIK